MMETKDELLARKLLQEDKKYSDRANFLLVAEGLLFSAFATLIADLKLAGYHLWIPVVICVAAIFLNVFWIATNGFQMREIITPLRNDLAKRINFLFANHDENDREKGQKLFDIYTWAPVLLAIAWVFMLAFYILQLTAGISI